MRRVRQVHIWLGLFFAPSILFFASSGALMTLGLHKTRSGDVAAPMSWIVRWSQIHRKQSVALPSAQAAKPASDKTGADGSKASAEGSSSVPFRGFVVLMAAGIVITTVLGIVMAFRVQRDRRLTWALLLLGMLLPVTLLLA